MPNFNFKSQVPIADIINAVQRKPLLQAQIDQMQADQKNQRLKTLLDTLSTGAGVVRTIDQHQNDVVNRAQTQLQNSQMANQAAGNQQLSGLIGSADLPATPTPLAPNPDGSLQGPSGTVADQPGYPDQLKAALLKANPSSFTGALSTQFATPKTLDQIMAERVKAGTLSLEDAAKLKNSFAPSFSFQTDPTTGLPVAYNNKNPTAPPISVQLPGQPPSTPPPVAGGAPTPQGAMPPPTGKPGAMPAPAAPASFNPKQIEYIGQAVNTFSGSPEVKEATGALSLVDAINKALDSNNPASLTNLRIAIARTSGVSPGSLTSNEIAGESGSKALGAKSARYITGLLSGKLSQTDLNDFRSLVADRKQAAQTLLANTLQDHSDTFAAVHPDVGSDRAKKVIGLSVRRYLRDYSPSGNPASAPPPGMTASGRYNQLKGQGLADDAIYNQLHKEGF